MLDATPLLRLYAHYRMSRLAALDPETVQRNELLKLVARAKETRIGIDHAFGRIRNVADYQNAVPLRRYEDFWKRYWKERFPVLDGVTWPGRIPYFALTSGTATGATKYIPVSRAMVKANQRAVVDLLAHHIANRPQSRILGGKNFMLGGGTDLTLCAQGVAMGDLSGIAVNEVPWWARKRYFPARIWPSSPIGKKKFSASPAVHLKKISGRLAEPQLASAFLRTFACVEAKDEREAGRILSKPGTLSAWRRQLRPIPPADRRLALRQSCRNAEGLSTSEGFIALATGTRQGLWLLLDNGLFFEFVPIDEVDAPNPTRHSIATAHPSINYALTITSCAGLRRTSLEIRCGSSI